MHIHDMTINWAGKPTRIYKIHVKTRKVVRLTHQEFTPNTGAARCRAARSSSPATATPSSPPKRGLPRALQLFVMDDDGNNVECIGHLNLGMALHPVVLKDGRIMFSSLESQGCAATTLGASGASTPTAPTGARSSPSTRRRAPTPSTSRRSSPTAASSSRSTTTRTTAASAPTQVPRRCRRPATRRSAPAYTSDPRNRRCASAGTTTARRAVSHAVQPVRHRVADAVRPRRRRPGRPSGRRRQRPAARVGKVTHPSGAPDNHLLTVWSPGPVNHGYTRTCPRSTAASTSSRTASRSTSRARCC